MNPRGYAPRELPPQFANGFSVRDARNAGIARARLRSLDLDAPYWGLRTPGSIDSTAARCRLITKRMPPDAFFSHVTAAVLHGFPLPLRLERSTRLDITLPAPRRAPHATGIIGHRLTVTPLDLIESRGLRVTTPARTWCDLGSVLSLLDLVAVGDFVIRRKAPLAGIAELAEVAESRISPRGRANVRAALPLLNERSESPPESILRVLIGWAGLPKPTANREIFDAAGNFIARVDLFIEQYKLVVEYQGDYHRTEQQRWRRDMTRRSRLEAVGLRYLDVNAGDLRNSTELIARIRQRVDLPA